jgi:hypothetical protein
MHVDLHRVDRGDGVGPRLDELIKKRRHYFRLIVRYFRKPPGGVHGVTKTLPPVLVFLSEDLRRTTCEDARAYTRFSTRTDVYEEGEKSPVVRTAASEMSLGNTREERQAIGIEARHQVLVRNAVRNAGSAPAVDT